MTDNVEKIEQGIEPVKPYTFKTLDAGDIAPMCKVIRAFGIKEFSDCFKADSVLNLMDKIKKEGSKNIEDVVGIQVIIEIADVIIKHIPDCENEIFAFFASITGLKSSEIKKFKLSVFAEMLIDFLEKEELMDFFKVVSKLFK